MSEQIGEGGLIEAIAQGEKKPRNRVVKGLREEIARLRDVLAESHDRNVETRGQIASLAEENTRLRGLVDQYRQEAVDAELNAESARARADSALAVAVELGDGRRVFVYAAKGGGE